MEKTANFNKELEKENKKLSKDHKKYAKFLKYCKPSTTTNFVKYIIKLSNKTIF